MIPDKYSILDGVRGEGVGLGTESLLRIQARAPAYLANTLRKQRQGCGKTYRIIPEEAGHSIRLLLGSDTFRAATTTIFQGL